ELIIIVKTALMDKFSPARFDVRMDYSTSMRKLVIDASEVKYTRALRFLKKILKNIPICDAETVPDKIPMYPEVYDKEYRRWYKITGCDYVELL
ncbi:MAG: hypothetical protein II399_00920, partial [Lachnospiraceae bacterium]|nr:hypothetical protein [Lachnospiraceae bacterium]